MPFVSKKRRVASRKSQRGDYMLWITMLGLAVAVTFGTKALFDIRGRASTVPVKAFPQAEGFGSQTEGGRFGKIIEVTNLNDSGTGSLRDALNKTWVDDPNDPYDHRRIIVFRVGGIIQAASQLVVSKPFTTIAGQTAPGDGIVIKGAPLKIKTHDVVVRGLRFRIGDGPGSDSTDRDGLGVSGNNNDPNAVYNVVLDHNSIAWGVDENMSTWYPLHDVTFSWNISAEALNCSIHIDEGTTSPDCHSMGLLIGYRAKNISIHHNLLAYNNGRNPAIQEDTSVEVINNVIAGWGYDPDSVRGSNTGTPNYSNHIGNYFIAMGGSSPRGIKTINNLDSGSKMYVKGNIGTGRLTDSGNEWDVVEDSGGITRVTSSALAQQSGITTFSADAAKAKVLSDAGALTPRRDSVDNRIISNVNAKAQPVSGKWFIDHPSEVGGWPIYPAGTPLTDTDKDGMPDSWETNHGLNPNDANDRNALACSGYTQVEEYINSLIPLPYPNLFVPCESSGTPMPTTQVSPTQTNQHIFEAEQQVLVSAKAESNNAGYSGTGFVNFLTLTNASVTWNNVSVPAAGNYPLTFRYALGKAGRNVNILVNGATVASAFSFPTTSSFTTWSTRTVTVPLQAGTNTVKVAVIDNDGPNLDYLSLQSATPSVQVTPANTPTLASTSANPTITTTSLPRATRGQPYTAYVAASDLTLSDILGMTATNLPPGLTLGSCALTFGFGATKLSCALTGAPSSKGNYSPRFTVIDALGHTATKIIRLRVR